MPYDLRACNVVATYGSHGNYVSMRSSYFTLEVRTKLAQSSFEVA